MTLIELLVAVTILSVGVLGLISAFGAIARSVQVSKSKAVATNLAQEKIESLKNVAYFRLLVTTNPATATLFTPNFKYDGPNGYYPPEVPLIVGGISFERRVHIRKVAENASGDLVEKSWSDPDTGLKEVQVYVVWKEGQNWKKVELRNLRDDPSRLPTEASLLGEVTSAALPLAEAKVEVIQNPVWNKLSDASGNYSFQVAAGTFTLRASKAGYFAKTISNQVINKGDAITANFDLVKMDSGTISGAAYLRDHIVISQVVASTVSGGNNYEYVELYNPTTWAWTMSGAAFALRYVDANNVLVTDIDLSFRSAAIPANGGYYLLANTGTVVAAGTTVAADAVYSTLLQNVIRDSKAGGIKLTNDADTVVYDKVGWSKSSDFLEPTAPAQAVEGTQVTLASGLGAGEQLVRSSENFTSINSPTGTHAWDANVNATDFNVGAVPQDRGLTYAPKNSATVHAPRGGTPASGAIVFADDNLAPSVAANVSGAFSLASVATGAWTLTVSSGLAYQTAAATVTANATVSAGNLALTSATANGYVTGRVTNDLDGNLASIQVSAPGVSVNTDSSGNYRLSVATGSSVQVVANPGNLNTSYTSEARDVAVTLGAVTASTDFILSRGGRIQGYSSSNGVDAFSGLIVVAKLGGVEMGSASAGSNGYFEILNLTTGTYIVYPFAATGEGVSPSTFTTILTTPGSTVFCGTFTVSGAQGKISGTLKKGSDPIATGVLVVITTSTITSDPPAVTSTLRTGTNIYYDASSSADGSYSVSVPGGYTYNVYAWYSTVGAASATTTRQSGSAAVTAGQTSTVNFTW
jgi:type II secretory pathway pseudopilin PulG